MKVTFVTGKGGVGKTSFASALALKKAQGGEKVLLVEFGPKSYLNYIFSTKKQASKIKPPKNLEVTTWLFDEVLIEFITYFLKVKPLVKKFFNSPIMKKLIKVAPSLRELVFLGKATSPFRNIGKHLDYDSIVIDSYSTGHFLALLRSPAGMMEAVSRGAMHDQCKTILEVLKDSSKVEYYVISLPEKLPVIETKEFVKVLGEEFKIKPKVIFNKVKSQLAKSGSSDFEKEYNEKFQSEKEFMKSIKIKTHEHIPYLYEEKSSDLVKSIVECI